MKPGIGFIHWYTENGSSKRHLTWIPAQVYHNGILTEIADTRLGVISGRHHNDMCISMRAHIHTHTP